MCSVVIPAHNEAAAIARTLAAVFGAPSVREVIVVADDCSDDTAAIARENGASVYTTEAGDKGTALATGLSHVSGPLVLFLDADLAGLRPQHVEGLCTLAPLGGMVVGLNDDAPATGLPPISGTRRLPTDFARTILLAGQGYRAELVIDAAVGQGGLPHRHLRMVGVHNPTRPWRHPLMWADLGLFALLHAPALLSYTKGSFATREQMLAAG